MSSARRQAFLPAQSVRQMHKVPRNLGTAFYYHMNSGFPLILGKRYNLGAQVGARKTTVASKYEAQRGW
jgi:hypothetical protein